MMAVIRHHANRRSQKKRSAEHSKKKPSPPVIDPLVNPGSSAHRHQLAQNGSSRPHHRMVTLAQSSPGDRSARAHQSKTATVMLGVAFQHPPRGVTSPASPLIAKGALTKDDLSPRSATTKSRRCSGMRSATALRARDIEVDDAFSSATDFVAESLRALSPAGFPLDPDVSRGIQERTAA